MPNDSNRFDAVARTRLGPIGLRTEAGAVAEVVFLAEDVRPESARVAEAEAAARQIEAYLHDPAFVCKVPLALRGTPFQLRVWQALRGIAAGSVVTYGQLAGRLGTSARAVGGACRANPCPILVPCHRVVAVAGAGGYAGATAGRWMAIKEGLLRHEGVVWPAKR